MKKLDRKSSVNVRRWASYAAAGAAAAVAVANEAEATVYYSGVLNTVLKHTGTASISFPVSLLMRPLSHSAHSAGSALMWMSQVNGPNKKALDFVAAYSFAVNETNLKLAGFKSAAAAYHSTSQFASRIGGGLKIASQHFLATGSFLLAAGSHANPYKFSGTGTTGFLAFEFEISGVQQYGWAQIENVGNSNGRGGNAPYTNDFDLISYGYSDSATFQTGQTAMPEPASVAMLAMGGLGLLAYRKRCQAKRAKVA